MSRPASPFVAFSQGGPLDQADGLRRLFAARRVRHLALVHNPFVAYAGVAIERLTSAFAALGQHTLVVDAADSARAPHEMAPIDLSACVEPLSAEVSFLAARGLPMRYVDTRGSTAAFLAALDDAAPRAGVVLVHAGASDLARLFTGRAVRPMLLADAGAESLTEAYAGMKVLAQRQGLLAYDLLVVGAAESPRTAKLARRIAECGDRFLGAALHDWAAIDPADAPQAPVGSALARLAAAQVDANFGAIAAGAPHGESPAAALGAAGWGAN
jgi:flagellar biosynthesis protein FlhG